MRGRALLLIAVALGVAAGLLLPVAAVPTRPALPPPAQIAAAGATWNLTPPRSWCTQQNGSTGTVTQCTGGGAAYLEARANVTSRLSGELELSGPAAIWAVSSGWACELEVELSGFVHPCPVPYDAPSVGTWSTNLTSGGRVDLATLPFELGAGTGLLPASSWPWLFLVVDAGTTPDVATATTPIVVVPVG